MSCILTEDELREISDEIFTVQSELKLIHNKFNKLVREAREKGINAPTESTNLSYIFWISKLNYAPNINITEGDNNE